MARKRLGNRLSHATRWAVRELIAVLCWVYFFAKVFVFDLDVAFVEHVAPEHSWVLRYRVVCFLLLVAIFWLVLGNRRFFRGIGFILAYPVFLGHRILGYLVRRWERYLFLAPVVGAAAWYFRGTFILYVFFVVSGLVVLVASAHQVIWFAGAVLATCLLLHYLRIVHRTYWDRPFEMAARFVEEAAERLAPGGGSAATGERRNLGSVGSRRERTPLGLVGVAYLSEIFAIWFEKFSRGRRFELMLPLAFLRTIVLTLLAFTVLYLAVSKIDPSSFSGQGEPSFLTFLAFSFDKLFASDSALIRAETPLAVVLANAQSATTVLIFVFFVFLLFTAQRDLTKDDLEDLVTNLRRLGKSAKELARTAFGQAFEALELAEFRRDPKLINGWRKRVGKPELGFESRSRISDLASYRSD